MPSDNQQTPLNSEVFCASPNTVAFSVSEILFYVIRVTVILPCIVYIIWQDYLNQYFAYQYNQATTKLALYFNEAVNSIKLAINYCHPGACQATQKLVHFYMLITLKHKKSWDVCEKPVLWWKTLIYWMDICCRCPLELPLWVFFWNIH